MLFVVYYRPWRSVEPPVRFEVPFRTPWEADAFACFLRESVEWAQVLPERFTLYSLAQCISPN